MASRAEEASRAAIRKATEDADRRVAAAEEDAARRVEPQARTTSHRTGAVARRRGGSRRRLTAAEEDAARRLTATEEAAETELRRARDEFAEQLARERATIAELTDAQAKLEPLLAAAINDADARSGGNRVGRLTRRRAGAALEGRRAGARASRIRAPARHRSRTGHAGPRARRGPQGSQTDAAALGGRQAGPPGGRGPGGSRGQGAGRGGPRPQGRPQGAPERRLRTGRRKGREEAEARAEAAVPERDALAKELDAATQVNRDEYAQPRARVEALDAEHQRLMREWQEDAVRLEVAMRERDVIAGERDALATELEALRQSTGAAQAEERARQQEFYDAAEQRIRELELQLLQPQIRRADDEPAPAGTADEAIGQGRMPAPGGRPRCAATGEPARLQRRRADSNRRQRHAARRPLDDRRAGDFTHRAQAEPHGQSRAADGRQRRLVPREDRLGAARTAVGGPAARATALACCSRPLEEAHIESFLTHHASADRLIPPATLPARP